MSFRRDGFALRQKNFFPHVAFPTWLVKTTDNIVLDFSHGNLLWLNGAQYNSVIYIVGLLPSHIKLKSLSNQLCEDICIFVEFAHMVYALYDILHCQVRADEIAKPICVQKLISTRPLKTITPCLGRCRQSLLYATETNAGASFDTHWFI